MDRYLLQQRTGTRIPPKTVYLVRHGESLHNAQALHGTGADLNDHGYVDAALTARGEAQADALVARVAALAPELVVTSPMTRATQTCLRACAALPARQPVVHTLCTERVAYSCDIGSTADVLQCRFPTLDYSGFPPREAWWWTPPGSEKTAQASLASLRKYRPGAYVDVEPQDFTKKRAREFRHWLLQLEERVVIVFAHGVFLTTLVGDGKHFGNAEIRKITL